MKVTTATAAGGTSADLNGTWTIAAASAGDGRRYQQRFTLSLATGGLAETLRIEEATRLRVKALAYDFNALDPAAPERAQINALGGDATGLRVTLPVPRLIGSLRFDPDVAPGGKTTEIYRTDGDVIADDPVASWKNPKPGPLAPATKSLARGKPQAQGVHASAVEGTGKAAAGGQEIVAVEISGGELDVVDNRFVTRLRGTSAVPLTPSDLSAVNLATAPENLRIGLRLPALGDEIFFLSPTFDPGVLVDADAALRERLTALLARLREALDGDGAAPPTPLPHPLAIELVVESDAPCRVTISQFELHYRLARASFPDGVPKQVLRPGGASPAPRQIPLAVPAGVTLTSATLTLAGDGPADSAGTVAAGTPAALGTLLDTPTASGLQLDSRHAWASPLALPEPVLCGGCDLLLAALAPRTRLRLALVAEDQGQPAGDLLASTEASLDQPYRRRLVRFALAEPRLLQPGNHWLLLECPEGTAVWYLRPSIGSHALQRRIHDWQGVDAVVDQSGVAAWVAAGGPSAAERHLPEIRLDGQPLPLLQADRDRVYDLAPALAASPSAASGLVGRTLEIIATGTRPVTVYPPEIQFELP